MTPCGQTRREFLWQTGAGFTGLALAAMLSDDGFFAKVRASETSAQPDPLAPKPPHFPTKAKRVIFLFMYGGPSQVDTFDPKPVLAAKHGRSIEIEVKKGTVGK